MARIRPITQVRSGPAMVSGSGVAPNIGAGILQAGGAGALGSGTRRVTSSGILVPSSSTVVGSQGLNNEQRIIAALEAAAPGYALPSNMSTLQYPADPITTGDPILVRTDSELAAAISQANREIRIYGPGNGGQGQYNGFNLTFGDILLDMDNDATVSVAHGSFGWYTPLSRVRWTGGNIRLTGNSDDNGFILADVEDFLFDNLNIARTGTSGSGHVHQPQGPKQSRLAWINSTLEQQGTTNTSAYSVFAFEEQDFGNHIWVGNLHIGGGPPVRMINQHGNNVMVGNYFAYIGSSGAVRIHRAYSGLWFAYNYLPRSAGNAAMIEIEVSDDLSDQTGVYMDDLLVERNYFYADEDVYFSPVKYGDSDGTFPQHRAQIRNFISRHNRWCDVTRAGSSSESFAGRSVNITVPYTQTDDLIVGPAHADYIADPGQAAFGADH